MSLRKLLRKVFLCIAVGGHSVLGVGMSQEAIEELLHAMNQTRVEMTIGISGEHPAQKCQKARFQFVTRV